MENNIFFEGGEEDDVLDEEAAETIKSRKGRKKGGKGKKKFGMSRKSSVGAMSSRSKNEVQEAFGDEENNLNMTARSGKSVKSSKSVGGRKKAKKGKKGKKGNNLMGTTAKSNIEG